MKKIIKILGLLLILLLVVAAVTVVVIPREKLITYVAPEVRYITVTNAVITETTAEMDVQLEVTSKLVPVYIDSLVYDFRLFGQSVARGSKKFSPASKNGKVQQLIIPVTLAQDKARELIRRQAAEGEKIKAHVEAYCLLPVVGLRRIDIDREVDMAIPMPGTEIVPVSSKSNY